MSSPERQWDVAIVGAGPAGSTAARLLAARGHGVLLLDRKPFPREKVCGDALIPDALAALTRAGLLDRVLDQGRRLDTLEVASASGISVVLPVRCVTLRRIDLDALLVEAAMAAGATLRTGEVEGLEQDGQGVVLHLAGARLRARAAVVATGAGASLFPGLASPPTAVALRHYVRASAGPERLLIAFHRSVLPGYGWIFPLRDGWYNVGCGVFARGANLKRLYERFLAEYAPAREIVARATESTRPKGAPLRCGLAGVDQAVQGRIVAVGETIGATFSLTGEGIGKAMETAERAADALDGALRQDRFERLAEFGPRLREELAPRYAGYAAGEQWLARPWMSDLLARGARRSAPLRRALAGILEESVDPSRVVTPWGILRSLLSV